MTDADVRVAALREAGYEARPGTPDTGVAVLFRVSTPPHMVFKAHCLGRAAEGEVPLGWEEWVARSASMSEAHRRWLWSHGVEVTLR